MVSSSSRLLSFEKKHVRKLSCIPGIVYWKHFSYICWITETCSQRNLFTRLKSWDMHSYCDTKCYWNTFHHQHWPYCITSAVTQKMLSNVRIPWEMRVKFPVMCVYCLTKCIYKNVNSILLVICWVVTVKVNYIIYWFALWYSQTCIRLPLLGPLKSGRLGQVVIL